MRGLIGVAVGLALAPTMACHGKTEPPPHETMLAPVEAPASLIAEGAITAPDATWLRLQRGIGAGAGVLPSTLGELICAASGLDAKLGAEVSGTSPAYLVVAGKGVSPSWVLAARLADERHARPLFEGVSPVFQVVDAGAGVVVLRSAQPTPVVGIAPGGWVVVGASASALAELAPYATRTLPTKARSAAESITIDLPQAALKGELADAVAKEWSSAQASMIADDRALRAEHGGRPPDFGDPHAILGALDGWVQGKVAALRDLRAMHVAISVTDDDVRAIATASPASPEGAAAAAAASLHPGEVAPLAGLPRETLVALLSRDDAATRARDSAGMEATLVATLGQRLAASDAKRVHEAFDDWRGAHGDWATLALTLTPTERGVVADVASSDPARSARGVREAMELVATAPAIRDPFESWLHARDVTLGATAVPGGGQASMATFVTASPISLAWVPGHDDLRLALGAAPASLLPPPLPGGTLGDDPILRATLGSIGDVAAAIVAQPGRARGCTATGAVVMALGVRPDAAAAGGQALWGTVVASDSSLRCLAKSFF